MHIGARFGKVVVTGRSDRFYGSGQGKKKRLWALRCDCGNTSATSADNLNKGRVLSCGCLKAARLIRRSTTHGLSGTSEYKIWKSMNMRCENPKDTHYSIYGGRGITVHPRWRHDFTAFLSDMGPRPSRQHSIDRIDGDGPYSPTNCRWATVREQVLNRACVHKLTIRGQMMTVAELAKAMRVPSDVVYRLLRKHGDHWLKYLTNELA